MGKCVIIPLERGDIMALKSKVTKEDLEHYLEQGLTMAEIGDIYGCDRKNITYYMKKFGLQQRDRSTYMRQKYSMIRGHDVDIEEVKRMIGEGMLIKEIAEKLNVSRSTLSTRCKESGLNFMNHDTQRKKHSEFMQTNNPVPKGTAREDRFIDNMNQARKYKFVAKLLETEGELTLREYSKIARHIAYSYYKRKGLYEKGKVIDHIYSIKDGYDNGIPVFSISYPTNLRLVTVEENMAKGSKSLCTLSEFYAAASVQRLSVKE